MSVGAASELPDPIPITVISGYLGAGKTTLLNQILCGGHGRRITVLVNDFGEISLDAELVIGATERIISLANGCVCCSIQNDLVAAVRDVVSAEQVPDAILIEASGVAQPSPMVDVLRRIASDPPVVVDAVVTVADVEQIRHRVADYGGGLVRSQLRAANIVVLSKVDLVSTADRERTRQWIAELVPGARVLDARGGDIPIEFLVDTGLADRLIKRVDQEQDTHATFDTWSFTTDRPLDKDSFLTAVWNLPTGIVRAKGLLSLAGDPRTLTNFQLVGRRATLTRMAATQPKSLSRLVVIGVPNSFEPEALDALFRSTMAQSIPLPLG